MDENIFVLDLSKSKSASDIIFELSSFLETDESLNKRICLRLGEVELNQSQILSVKFLIGGRESSIESIETQNEATRLAALALGIIITNAEIKEPEKEYVSVEQIKEQQNSVEEQPSHSDTNEVPADVVVDMQSELDVIFKPNNQLEKLSESLEVEKEYLGKDSVTDVHFNKEEFTKEDVEIENFETKYIKQTIRSGQMVNFDGNLVIIGDCHPGCEINAAGDITVWGVLGGIAHAGNMGNTRAKVRALKLNPIQIRIADLYSRRPDAFTSVTVEKTNEFTPEEAGIINNEIVVFKIND